MDRGSAGLLLVLVQDEGQGGAVAARVGVRVARERDAVADGDHVEALVADGDHGLDRLASATTLGPSPMLT